MIPTRSTRSFHFGDGMKVEDANGVRDEVNDADQLESVLARKYPNDWNQFWLQHGKEAVGYPTLSIVVKDDLAYLSYLPRDREAGWCSIGNIPGLNPEGDTRFSINKYSGDDIYIRNEFVVPYEVALSAAKEYLTTRERPRCVDWFEL